jgi:hypothetical protein
MKDSGFLVISKRGIVTFRKGREGKYGKYKSPALGPGERSVFITVDVPDSVFEPKPTPEATIRIPEDRVIHPSVDVTVNQPPETGEGEVS